MSKKRKRDVEETKRNVVACYMVDYEGYYYEVKGATMAVEKLQQTKLSVTVGQEYFSFLDDMYQLKGPSRCSDCGNGRVLTDHVYCGKHKAYDVYLFYDGSVPAKKKLLLKNNIARSPMCDTIFYGPIFYFFVCVACAEEKSEYEKEFTKQDWLEFVTASATQTKK